MDVEDAGGDAGAVSGGDAGGVAGGVAGDVAGGVSGDVAGGVAGAGAGDGPQARHRKLTITSSLTLYPLPP